MIGTARACSSRGGIFLGRRTRFCASCAPKRTSKSDPRYVSRQWKRTVADVKRRGGYRCQHCGATEPLVVDRKTPHDPYPGSFYDRDNPWTLCQADDNSKRELTDEECRCLARMALGEGSASAIDARGLPASDAMNPARSSALRLEWAGTPTGRVRSKSITRGTARW